MRPAQQHLRPVERVATGGDPGRSASAGPHRPAGPRRASPVGPSAILALQRAAGNRATTHRIETARRAGRAQPGAAAATPRVQRLDLYGQPAAQASPLPEATATEFARLVDGGDQAGALRMVVDAMTARGDLDPKLLRTSGEGELWQIGDLGELAALVSFRAPFADPDDPAHRLPNPRFRIGARMLSPGRSDALIRLHTGILHEFRHVRQAAERVNRPAGEGEPREPGYANDPDEFDAYLSEVELSYDRMHMYSAALQAGVGWEFLAEADRRPFRARWRAAERKIARVLGYDLSRLLSSPAADRYRQQMRDAERRAREAWERNAR